MGGEDDSGAASSASSVRKTFWRSQSWSASRTASGTDVARGDATEKGSSNGQIRRYPLPPLTPRAQNSKARSCLPPLQPLSIARRSLDEWPKASSDDVGEWLQPPTPSGRSEAGRPGEGLKVDLSSLRSQDKKDQIAFFDKECSKVADHIYLGGNSVARNREILRQNGITHVLNCVGFVCPEYFKTDLEYKTLWLQDSPTEDITSILYDVFDYFEDVREKGGKVLVHCCQGVSRSTSLVIAYLMWREGQSFDDAFQFVKAARGIANPNMGFACQLLQCQKRVHAIPLSPNSGLRMYRMAPHSPYDALHLVPKLLIDSSPAALDSRGAFILHVVSSIFVWIGKNCDPAMGKDAKAAAFQVVRYERVPGPIITVQEGEEPMEFWDAFSSSGLLIDNATGNAKEQTEPGKRPGVGRRRVEAYDGDFDLFYQAITGGVVPAFPSSGPGQETHLPARESNWSLLRRKFLCCTVSRFFSDSALVREIDPHANQVPLATAESSTSPSHLSPSSLSSESSISSTSSSQSPSSSPSTSSPLLTPSQELSTVSNLTESFVPPSAPKTSVCPEQSNTSKNTLVSHPKGLRHSIAERRGSFLPMKLPSMNKDSSLLSRMLIGASSNCSESAQKVYIPINDDAEQRVHESSDLKNNDEYDFCGLRGQVDFKKDHVVGEETLLSCSFGSFGICQESGNSMKAIVYRWPNLEKFAAFSRDDLDPKAVFIFLIQVDNKDGIIHRMVYLWIGRSFKHDHQHAKLTFGNNMYEVSQINWNQVGLDFLALMGLPSDLQIKVFEGEDAERFLDNIE